MLDKGVAAMRDRLGATVYGEGSDDLAAIVLQLLRDINSAGTAIIMATHDLELTKREGFRVLEVNRGQLVFDSADPNGPAKAGI